MAMLCRVKMTSRCIRPKTAVETEIISAGSFLKVRTRCSFFTTVCQQLTPSSDTSRVPGCAIGTEIHYLFLEVVPNFTTRECTGDYIMPLKDFDYRYPFVC